MNFHKIENIEVYEFYQAYYTLAKFRKIEVTPIVQESSKFEFIKPICTCKISKNPKYWNFNFAKILKYEFFTKVMDFKYLWKQFCENCPK